MLASINLIVGLCIAQATTSFATECEFHWGYDVQGAPMYWHYYFPLCGGTGQSPIDIDDDETVRADNYGPIIFDNFDRTDGVTMTLTNNGHSVEVDMDVPGGTYRIFGGRLPETFQLKQFHFHFGSNNTVGSEHTVNGRHYPMEMHLVAYDNRYSSFADAKTEREGLVVVGVFFKIDRENRDNELFEEIVSNLNQIRYKGDRGQLNTFPLSGLLPGGDRYFRYYGSLTTPTCDESVIWSLLRTKIAISQRQMNAFRDLFATERGHPVVKPLINNYRPTQPLNGRTVFQTGC